VTRDFFRRRLELIKRLGYTVLPLGQAIQDLESGALPKRSLAITFDDGFYNFYSAAAPILTELGLPATLYVSTYYCSNQRPILRLVLSYVLWRAHKLGRQTVSIPKITGTVSLGDKIARENLVDQWVAQLRKLTANREERMTEIERVAISLGVDWQDVLRSRLFHLITYEEMAELSRAGFDIQLHTHRHRTPRDHQLFRCEILENRRLIEEQSRISPTHFCYPSGDYDRTFFPWLRDMGVRTATTCESGLASQSSNTLLLPRFIDTLAQSEVTFRSWLSGTAHFLSFSGRGTRSLSDTR
jgi:peptidoglycan/xylan/chitin deacetylase (PgdA/CDA1 family)